MPFKRFAQSLYCEKKFNIELSSDLDFEGMVVEVCFDNQVIATCNYEKGQGLRMKNFLCTHQS